MRLCFYDYESFWSVTHSLSKMNPIEYVMHPETEIQSLSIAFDNWPVDVFFGEERIRHVLSKIDWSDTMMVAHNGSGFDHMITRWRLGIKPAAWGCTLAMARPFYGLTCGVSLKKVAEAMGVGVKGSLEATNTKGKKLKDFTPEELAAMTVYNRQDTELCRKVFLGLAPRLGTKELKLIDMSVQMTVEPAFQADVPLLKDALTKEIDRKNLALLDLSRICGVYQPGMSADQAAAAMKPIVMSQPQFAGLLDQFGAPIPMKESKTALDEDGNPKMIPALAKTDQGLEDLLEYQDPGGDERKSYAVQTAAATRLEVKSTQLETRLATFINVAKQCNGRLPMPVNYGGAFVSWRFSGAMKMNCQNMPRVNPKEPKPGDALRQSLVAPEGKAIVVVDSSNIELRVAHGLAGQEDTLEKLKAKEDLYCWFASYLFGRVITDQDKAERFIGKVAMLSLQYGASWRSFQNMARILSGGKTLISDDECKRIVKLWRSMFKCIADYDTGIWKKCDNAIVAMAAGSHVEIDVLGLCTTDFERINTPDNHWLQYPVLCRTMKIQSGKPKDAWVYGEGRNKRGLYGSHMYENICQHIARLVVMEQTLKLHKLFPVALSCHDEAAMVVDDDRADECKEVALKIFSTAPKWWPDLPLGAAADIAYTYADAK